MSTGANSTLRCLRRLRKRLAGNRTDGTTRPQLTCPSVWQGRAAPRTPCRKGCGAAHMGAESTGQGLVGRPARPHSLRSGKNEPGAPDPDHEEEPARNRSQHAQAPTRNRALFRCALPLPHQQAPRNMASLASSAFRRLHRPIAKAAVPAVARRSAAMVIWHTQVRSHPAGLPHP